MSSVHPPQPSPAHLALKDKQIAYTVLGRGPTVVALHGYPGTSRDFRSLARRLCASFRVVCIDMPGFGDSPATNGLASYDQDAHTLREVLEALQIEHPILLTHSMGGAVAACALERVPRLASAVVWLAPPGLAPHRQYRRIPCKALSKALSSEAARRGFAPLARLIAKWAGFPEGLPADSLYRSTHMAARFEIDAHARRMRSLQVPAMLAYALDDPMVESAIFRGLAAVLPAGPRLEFRDGGHYVQQTHAEAIAAAMEAWLRG